MEIRRRSVGCRASVFHLGRNAQFRVQNLKGIREARRPVVIIGLVSVVIVLVSVGISLVRVVIRLVSLVIGLGRVVIILVSVVIGLDIVINLRNKKLSTYQFEYPIACLAHIAQHVGGDDVLGDRVNSIFKHSIYATVPHIYIKVSLHLLSAWPT